MNPMVVRKVYFNTLLDIVKNIVILHPAQDARNTRYIRLEETTFNLSKEVEEHSQVVTAHKLSQYLNTKYSVQLDESVECWFDWFIEDRVNELEGMLQ